MTAAPEATAPGARAPKRNQPRWLRVLGIVVVAMLLGSGSLAGWLWWQWNHAGAAAPDGASVGASVDASAGASITLRITPGMTMTAAADSLVAGGLLASGRRRVFLLGAKLSGQDRQLRTGRFALPASSSPRQLLAALVEGQPIPVRVTLPEGLDVFEASQLIAAALDLAPATFLSAADSLARTEVRGRGWLGAEPTMDHYDSLLTTTGTPPASRVFHWAEGYLAPDTYHFAEGSDAVVAARAVVGLQLARIDSALQQLGPQIIALGLTPHQLVTLASIVEAEARRADERERIAAVYVNRLLRGSRLEADPTVAYLLNKKGQRLWYRDLRVSSPYNTYRRQGLPPGPIGNPGRAALAAATRPDTTCTAFYFVADGAGGHVFSQTAAEHEEAVRQYRRQRRRSTR